jgi:hypothetical protein
VLLVGLLCAHSFAVSLWSAHLRARSFSFSRSRSLARCLLASVAGPSAEQAPAPALAVGNGGGDGAGQGGGGRGTSNCKGRLIALFEKKKEVRPSFETVKVTGEDQVTQVCFAQDLGPCV